MSQATLIEVLDALKQGRSKFYLRPNLCDFDDISYQLHQRDLYFNNLTIVVRTGPKDFIWSRQNVLRIADICDKAGRGDEYRALIANLRISAPSWAGLDLQTPHLMGIVNVTPDSFSDGGDFVQTEKACKQIDHLVEQGASIFDIGGESTRPGAQSVELNAELDRVIPVIEYAAKQGLCVSVDTRHSAVMKMAAEAGANIINDVTALTNDPGSKIVAAKTGLHVVLMHMQGKPQTMQKNPSYDQVVLDIYDYLEKRIEECVKEGIPKEKIALDPGIGFGKTLNHNLQLINWLPIFHGLGCPLLLGVSRKSYIAKLMGPVDPKDREPATIAHNLQGLQNGVQLFRVHDVGAHRQAFHTWLASKNTSDLELG